MSDAAATAGALNHTDSGAGAPSLVFVHGLTCALDDWRAQVDALDAHHRCIALDLPGHGASPANGALTIERFGAEVARTVPALDAPPAVLVGHSMGCRVVLEAARLLGTAVVGLVLVDGSRRAGDDAERVRRQTREAIDAAGFEPYVRSLFDVMFTDVCDAAVRERIIERALRLDPHGGAALIADMSAWDVGRMDRVLGSIDVPVLMIQSTGVDAQLRRVSLQPGATTPFIDAVRQRVADVRIEIVPGVGHFTMIEAPREVTGLIAGFARATAG